MSATLYLLRQQPDRISPSLFREGDTDTDIVFVDRARLTTLPSMNGATVSNEGMTVSDSRQMLRYEDLVEKIFSAEHIIVL